MEKVIEKILEKNQIKFENLKKSESGFSNLVYFVDDKYVIKLCDDEKAKQRLSKEIDFYKNTTLSFIPRYIASGEYKKFCYLIIEKIKGQTLYKVWHKFDDTKRRNVVSQISEILIDFHTQDGTFLADKYVFKDWRAKWQKSFEINIQELKKKGFDSGLIERFSKTKLDKIMTQQKLGLVYNDAHFDNLIINDGKVKLIDFDRIIYGSIDYELLIIDSMINNPAKFANEEDEENAQKGDYSQILEYLKLNYPDMFDFQYFEERIFIYKFIYNLGNAFKYNHLETIQEELSKFENYFYKEEN